MTIKNILLLITFTPFIGSCALQERTNKIDYTPENPEIKQQNSLVSPTTNHSKMSYDLTATVNQSRIINKGRGAAAGKFPAKQLIATVTTVKKGTDISVGQQIFIELATEQASCNVGSTCHFIAPYKHPANKKIVQLLKAQVIP